MGRKDTTTIDKQEIKYKYIRQIYIRRGIGILIVTK